MVLQICRDIKTKRNTSGVLLKLMEEVGELSTEANIKYHGAYKEPGEDGIIGECVDAMICLYDILNLEGATEEQIRSLLIKKTNKWKDNIGGIK